MDGAQANNVGRQFGWCRQQPQAAEAVQQMRRHGTRSPVFEAKHADPEIWLRRLSNTMEVWMPASCDIHALKWQRWVEWAMNKNRAADYELAGFSWSSRVRTLNMRSGSRLRLRPQCCHVQCKGHWSHDSSIWNPQPTHKWERQCPANSCSTTKWSEMMVLWRGACDDTCGPMQVEAKISDMWLLVWVESKNIHVNAKGRREQRHDKQRWGK